MSLVNAWMQHPWTQTLGWALLHSLWQGVVLAAALSVILHRLRRAKPEARYLASYLTLVCLVVFPLLTACLFPSFFWEASPAEGIVWAKASAPLAFCQSLLPHLVALWAVGVVAMSARMFGGWVALQRMAKRNARPLLDLQERAVILAHRMGVGRIPEIWESAHVSVPSVMGCWRSVVLIPSSALLGLTPEALEALLAHELAHIRRHDYLFNLIQSVLETLLFYHPATWNIAKRIRQEREQCCDDLAVATLGDPVIYVRALASMEALRVAPTLAMTSNGGDLLARVRRLLYANEEPSRDVARPTTGLVALTLCGLIGVSALLPATQAQPTPPLATFAVLPEPEPLEEEVAFAPSVQELAPQDEALEAPAPPEPPASPEPPDQPEPPEPPTPPRPPASSKVKGTKPVAPEPPDEPDEPTEVEGVEIEMPDIEVDLSELKRAEGDLKALTIELKGLKKTLAKLPKQIERQTQRELAIAHKETQRGLALAEKETQRALRLAGKAIQVSLSGDEWDEDNDTND